MNKQTQIFENSTDEMIEIYVEPYPDRYRLKPKDILQITYDHDGTGYGLYTFIHKDGLAICPEHFDTTVVLINDIPVEPWQD